MTKTNRSTSAAALISLAGLALSVAALTGCASKPLGPGDVAGRYIVAICDADMSATAFGTGALGERDPGARDCLTIVSLPITEPQTDFAQIAVSNSALGPPNALSVSADGRLAFVVESRGPAGSGAMSIGDLSPGENLAVIDLSAPMSPRLLGTIVVGVEPTAVAAHPSQRLVAVANRSPRQQLVMVAYDEHGYPIDDAMAWPLFGLDDDSARATGLAWRPQGDGLAVTLPERDEVMFYRFGRDADGSAMLTAWGGPVRVGKYPYSGAFTPDGRFFITTDLQWGPEVEGFIVGAPAGQLTVIRLDDEGAHRVVSTATVGVSPEGLAISRDGRLVATSNLMRTFLPEEDARATQEGSLSLLTLSPATGELTHAGEFPIAAMPAGIAFDAKDQFLAVTQFRSFDPNATTGELSFWRVNRSGSRPSLEQMDFYVGLGQGPHGVLIIR
ncbi:MAG: beta-propeller fold lactonase family protein [Phycisphaeraceae bacterium]|nr:beta-propeller fold lactonase family protein [Phycisphaeraceae bacterium]